MCFNINGFDFGVFVVNYYFFLFFVFDEDQFVDIIVVVFVGNKMFNFNGNGIWQFGVEKMYQFFMNDFRCYKVLRVIGDVIFWEVMNCFW